MSLTGFAKENLSIFAQGGYVAPSGKAVSLSGMLERATGGTTLYRPNEMAALLAGRRAADYAGEPPAIEVTAETTGAAIRRLLETEGCERVVTLNFASARNPGGGFLGGAKAQEEDLCRSAALYPCLLTQRDYYEANRAQRSALYTDHLIYSPDVPFLRDESRRLLEQPFVASFITAPAPNAGAVARNEPSEAPRVAPTLERRSRYVLAVAADHGHRVLVLGAWGCGAFRNDPNVVAPILREAIADPCFAGAFDRMVFAIYDSSKGQATMGAFRAAFQPPE
jgi:uncharacterized protein (TIGR02452 family)